jgi:thiamine transport system ATP-binding protein
MLEVTDLIFKHNGQSQSYRFDLTIAAGEIVGLTGKSGSGKSTLLDLIAGFLRPASGEITVDGKSLLSLPPEDRPITTLFQRNNLFEHLTAAQNVGLGINTSLKLSNAEIRVIDEALDRVGLLSTKEQRSSNLSGGEQQRVALARSLVRNRPVLLLDEPFSALDADTRTDMLALVKEIVAEKNLATLMVTHEPADCEVLGASRSDLTDRDLHNF